jgi:peptidoglycan hydrolase-like protein with peptidoglycan-binding domain
MIELTDTGADGRMAGGEASDAEGLPRGTPLPPAASRLIRRQRMVIGVALSAALLSVLGLVAATLIKSPAQQAAEQGPPVASVLSAPVQRTVLRSTVTVRGSVVPTGSIQVAVPSPAGASIAVLSATPKRAGDRVQPGDLLAEVSGRPVLALPGPVPAYRDLHPGDTGRDVRRLQDALRSIGYRGAGSSARFDAGTEQAVRALYRDRGYQSDAAGKGVTVPASELVFVPSFPAVLGSLQGALGTVLDRAGGPLLTLDVGGLQVRALVPAGQQEEIRPGQAVAIEDGHGRAANGSVITLGPLATADPDPPGRGGPQDPVAGPAGYPLLVRPVGGLDAGWSHGDVILHVATSSTAGPVLVVPVAAVTTTADGTASVWVLEGGGQRRVPVDVGATADGEAEVRPRGGDRLGPGDRVVTGR